MWDSIPSLSRRPASFDPARRTSLDFGWDRRSFVKALVFAASAAMLKSLGTVPMARASHVGSYGYRIDDVTDGSHSPNCYQTTFYQSNATCNVCGPSTSVGSACVSSGHKIGYHKDVDEGSVCYQLREGQCSHDSSYDGWLWETPSTCCSICRGVTCGCYKNATVRCHDGEKCNGSCGNCSNTICQWRTAGSSCTGCAV
jgi:hypothetical protein